MCAVFVLKHVYMCYTCYTIVLPALILKPPFPSPPPQLYRYAAAVFLYRIEISQKTDHMTAPFPPPPLLSYK
jgi:hypothetical protein